MHSVNLAAVVRSDYPAVVRKAAQLLIDHPYLDVGTFLKGLNRADLDELVGFCNAVTLGGDFGDALDYIILLGEMVAQAEGTPLDSPDINRSSNLMILLTFEDLARKGVIEFDREKATLGGDLQALDIARLRQPR